MSENGQGDGGFGPPPGQPPQGQPPHGQPPHGQPPQSQGGWGQPPQGQPPQGQPPQGQRGWGQPPQGQPPQSQASFGNAPGQPQPVWGPPPPGPGWFAQQQAAGYVPDAEERDHAFYAHLFAGIANVLFCGMLIPVAAPLVVFAMAKEKRPFMLFHVNQAVVFQTALFAINSAIGIVGTVLTFFCIGPLFFLLLPITIGIAAIYPIILGLRARDGGWGAYPILGEKMLREWKPLFT